MRAKVENKINVYYKDIVAPLTGHPTRMTTRFTIQSQKNLDCPELPAGGLGGWTLDRSSSCGGGWVSDKGSQDGSCDIQQLPGKYPEGSR